MLWAMDDQTLAKILTAVLNKVEKIRADAEDASNHAFATRSALSAALKESNPELEKKFQGWIDHFQPVASHHGVDPEVAEIRRQLAQLLPK
jgi:hypothetical protein